MRPRHATPSRLIPATLMLLVLASSAPAQTLVLPLSYSFGLLGQLLPALAAGLPTALLGNLVELKALLDEGQLVGMLSGVPSHHETLLRLLGDGPLRTQGVTQVVSAGAALSLPLRQRLLRAFPSSRIYTNYGQTELSPRVLCLRSDHPAFLVGPLPWAVDVRQPRYGVR